MAVRPAHHRRIAIAALFLSFVVATMLLTFHLSNPTKDQEADGPPAGDVAPVGAGVTLTVSSLAEWDAAARPGDVIRLTASINARLVYRGDNDGGTATGADGTMFMLLV